MHITKVLEKINVLVWKINLSVKNCFKFRNSVLLIRIMKWGENRKGQERVGGVRERDKMEVKERTQIDGMRKRWKGRVEGNRESREGNGRIKERDGRE